MQTLTYKRLTDQSWVFTFTSANTAMKYPVLLWLALLIASSFGRSDQAAPPQQCNPNAKAFDGYTFIHPGIVQANSAYAPYLVQFGDYYNQYFETDIAKQENIAEWKERFCYQSPASDVERIVYLASRTDLQNLYNAASMGAKEAPHPFKLNLFAQQIVSGKCTEVPQYLMFANSCQLFADPSSDKWKPTKADSLQMANRILEGLELFKHTNSHFIRQRIAYQVIRMAHYSRNYPQVVELYNYLIPKVDRRKNSIIYWWSLGHLAGALQKLGKRSEAAYRYMLVFRNDPGKRATAHRSFYLRDDKEWAAALALCQDNREKATMYILRASASRIKHPDDLKAIYALDPANKQLGLLLVSSVQSLERVILTNQFTELRNNKKPDPALRNAASRRLIELQDFVRLVMREGKADNLKLWKCMDAYLSVLRFDNAEAQASLEHCRRLLEPNKSYDNELSTQLDIWTHLLHIHQLDPGSAYAEDAAFRIRSLAIHLLIPSFEPYLKERLGIAYGKSQHPGKAVVTAFDRRALLYNLNLEQLDDLIGSLSSGESSAIETDMATNKYMESDIPFYIEAKGTALLGMAQPEAAYQTLQKLPLNFEAKKFSPFKERISERVHTPVSDSVNVTRKELAAKILEYQFAAKANFDKPDVAAKYLYLLGLCYYNCSYFGYSWEAFDPYRSGASWTRLAKGPVFPLSGTPAGNLELLNTKTAMLYFDQALRTAKSKEWKARAAFMAARCQQKAWFTDARCTYKPGSKEIPVVPAEYSEYQNWFLKNCRDTEFYKQVIAECLWYGAYARRQ